MHAGVFRVTAVQSQRSETQAKLASWVVDRGVRDFLHFEEKSRWVGSKHVSINGAIVRPGFFDCSFMKCLLYRDKQWCTFLFPHDSHVVARL